MKKRDDTVYLNDILDAIAQIETYLIAHDYFIVDIRVVWDTAKNDLAPLKEQVSRILHQDV